MNGVSPGDKFAFIFEIMNIYNKFSLEIEKGTSSLQCWTVTLSDSAVAMETWECFLQNVNLATQQELSLNRSVELVIGI